MIYLKASGFCTYLCILLCKLLEHVGVYPAVPLIVLLSLFLAHWDLQSRGLILGVYFQHFLKVALGWLKLIHEQLGFTPPVQALLIGTVQSKGLGTDGLCFRKDACTLWEFGEKGLWPRKLEKAYWKDQAQGNYVLLIKISKLISVFNAISIKVPRGLGRRTFEKFI